LTAAAFGLVRKDARMAVPVYTAAACGTAIDVPVNDSFALELEENPTTGYRWDFEADPGLEVLSSNFASNQSGAIGGGGMRQVMIRATQAGSFVLRGRLWRSWLGDSSAINRCEITVRAS
jgi:inhibitor of cysteine peptidase